MSERVARIGESPAFNSRAHSEALDRHIGKSTPLKAGDPYQVFQYETAESLTPFVRWIRGALRDKVNELTEFTADLKTQQDKNTAKDQQQDNRLAAIEAQLAAQPRPFP